MTNHDKEFKAMADIFKVLKDMDEGARSRAVAWVASALEIDAGKQRNVVTPASQQTSDNMDMPTRSHPEDFAELYGAFNPNGEEDKALVAAYWIQVIEGDNDWKSFRLNKLLKDLGHEVGHITNALSIAIKRKPSYVLQTKKGGKSKKSTKTYKLTQSGIAYVEAKLNGVAGKTPGL